MQWLKKTILFAIIIFIPLNPALATLRSTNYIIRESVLYSPDGPAISSVSATPGETTATITWTTDLASDSFVIYDTASNLAASKEQGFSAQTALNHSVTLTGLTASTVYYYKVRSTLPNGGSTTNGTVGSFTTTAATEEEQEVAAASTGGGGLLIIDKTDKVPPVISAVTTNEITYNSAVISWKTDEDSTSFIEYGESNNLGHTYGTWNSVKDHTVKLENLVAKKTYYYRVLSSDSAGNLARSDTFSLLTSPEVPSEVQNKLDEIDKNLPSPTDVNQTTEQSILEKLDLLNNLSKMIPGPIISGQPKVDVTENSATISWKSDKRTIASIGFIPSSENLKSPNAYPYVSGNFSDYLIDHSITLHNLKPSTQYNYQVKMKPLIGKDFSSQNFVFRTMEEGLTISNFYVDVIDVQKANFKWVTNKEADSTVRFTPYRGNTLAVEEAKTFKDNNQSVIHSMEINSFVSGLTYDIQLISQDKTGALAIEEIKHFSTGVDNEPPEISQVQTNSTIFIDKENKAQTIVSWRTDEPATSKVFYSEGVRSANDNWDKGTPLDLSYTKNHVAVINNFKTGTVYSFRIESTDSTGNTSLSKVFTLITPSQKRSVFSLIVGIFESLFGWVTVFRS